MEARLARIQKEKELEVDTIKERYQSISDHTFRQKFCFVLHPWQGAKALDWFKLIERSGPFLSEAVLNDALPSGGLEDVGSNIRKRVRSTYEEWQRSRA